MRHIGRHTVETSSEEKLMFPDAGLTKGDLIEYYRRIAPVMLPHVQGRPLTLHRFPEGINGDGFFQQHAPDYFPAWIDRATRSKEGGAVTHLVCNTAAALVYLANQSVIALHAWLSRTNAPRQPDQLVIDLDPAGSDFGRVCTVAQHVRAALEENGFVAFAMTTGSSGMHVRAPLQRAADFDTVRAATRRLADQLVEAHPQLCTTEQRIAKRGDRVFLDTARNAYGQTVVAPYSVRARPGAPIATPLSWDELGRPDLTPQRYTMRNLFRRLGQKDDPWDAMGDHARPLPHVD
jgi:bifunctional non-homologous end joining protein LigD